MDEHKPVRSHRQAAPRDREHPPPNGPGQAELDVKLSQGKKSALSPRQGGSLGQGELYSPEHAVHIDVPPGADSRQPSKTSSTLVTADREGAVRHGELYSPDFALHVDTTAPRDADRTRSNYTTSSNGVDMDLSTASKM